MSGLLYALKSLVESFRKLEVALSPLGPLVVGFFLVAAIVLLAAAVLSWSPVLGVIAGLSVVMMLYGGRLTGIRKS